jgi:hypothetical protein
MTSVPFDAMWSSARSVLNSVFGETVTLSGAEGTVTGITASWFTDKAANAIERHATGGGVTASLKRQWRIAKSVYLIGTRTTPQRGDRVIDGNGTQWELLPEDNQEAWQDMGADWHLFTKKAA